MPCKKRFASPTGPRRRDRLRRTRKTGNRIRQESWHASHSARKQPAAARRLLVGDAFGFYLDGEVGIHALHILLVECQFTDVIIAYGIAERLVGSRA